MSEETQKEVQMTFTDRLNEVSKSPYPTLASSKAAFKSQEKSQKDADRQANQFAKMAEQKSKGTGIPSLASSKANVAAQNKAAAYSKRTNKQFAKMAQDAEYSAIKDPAGTNSLMNQAHSKILQAKRFIQKNPWQSGSAAAAVAAGLGALAIAKRMRAKKAAAKKKAAKKAKA
jgi:hypothetical protein